MKNRFNNLKRAGILLCIFCLLCVQTVEAKPKHPLIGIWTLEYKDGKCPVVCYKLLKKNGEYVNLKSTDWNAKYFQVSRKGKYTISANRYAEVLMEYDNNQMFPPAVFLLNYKFIGDDTLKITYSIDGRRCEEVWHRARKAPRY